MSFKPTTRHMIDSYKGMGLVRLMQEKHAVLERRAELDRQLSAISRAASEIRRGKTK
jgi:hypothetical protein